MPDQTAEERGADREGMTMAQVSATASQVARAMALAETARAARFARPTAHVGLLAS